MYSLLKNQTGRISWLRAVLAAGFLLVIILSVWLVFYGPNDKRITKKEIILAEEKVIIGNNNDVGVENNKFVPEIKLNKWGEEAALRVWTNEPVENKATEKDGKIISKTKDGKKEFNLYPLTAEEIKNENGGFEFEIILNSAPASNVVTVNIDLKGLECYYQPPLNLEEKNNPEVDYCTETDCYKDNRSIIHRPENVVGSYACYRDNNISGDYSKTGGKNYKTGKAFHIYRPQMADAKGTKVWGELKIDNGILAVTIPQDFIDKAAYPIRHAIGATFGYTTAGGTSAQLGASDQMRVRTGTPASGNGVVTGVKFYAKKDGYDTNIVGAVYDNVVSLLSPQGAAVSVNNTTAQWWTSTITSGPSVTNAGTYWVAFLSDNPGTGAFSYYYDSGGVSGDSKYGTPTYPNWPADFTGLSDSTSKYSIYADYNVKPTINSVADTPDPTNPNRSVSFITNWTDADTADSIKVKVCKSNAITSQVCDAGSWASSTDFTTTNPVTLVYDVVGGDAGLTRDYAIFVCSDKGVCSDGTTGTFSVNGTSQVPDIKVRGGAKVR